ncbi:MAG: RNA-binding protein [Roseovarius sp.]|nr:RNA-binding protein [Roseovarius sp.]|tara:strand:+ start:607 stop:1122 length:516 start_codon:yes stop_codon:yes gene_type:complete
MATRQTVTRGFKRTAALLQPSIRRASESRGFSQARLLTHWSEIAGESIARIARPVEISYGRQGLGATLTLLTTGAQAPMLEMQKEALRERINAVYGYNAITRIRLTQTAPSGFAEGQVDFTHRRPAQAATPEPETLARAGEIVAPVSDDSLRAALERLARNVLTRSKKDRT